MTHSLAKNQKGLKDPNLPIIDFSVWGRPPFLSSSSCSEATFNKEEVKGFWGTVLTEKAMKILSMYLGYNLNDLL